MKKYLVYQIDTIFNKGTVTYLLLNKHNKGSQAST